MAGFRARYQNQIYRVVWIVATEEWVRVHLRGGGKDFWVDVDQIEQWSGDD